MERIKITPVSEKVVERQPQWPSGWYREITERVGVDQYGRQWHSFHSRLVFDHDPSQEREELSPGDKPATTGEP